MAYDLDTNCLLRWLLWDNEQQALVVDRYLETSKSKLHVADMTVAEVVWVLKKAYAFDDRMTEGFIRKIVEHENIKCNRMLFNKVLDNMNSSPRVSFIDLCLAHYAGLSDTKLLTFDKTLAKKLPDLVALAT